MIIAKFDHLQELNNYHILIHRMDGETFATCYKNGDFYHHSEWNKSERGFINDYILQGIESPQYPEVIHLKVRIKS